ncbi:hypothetical protein HDV03_000129 [Kappamyces sp. JEL0829]|nr:hypothetical protein HDV03_000129 [Kappamyces sp. JEL0829]
MATNYPSCFPVIYHDIQLEIPVPFQGLCTAFYRGWQFLICGGVVLDLLCSVIIAATTNTPLVFFGWHILWLFIFPVATFVSFYWPLYRALRRNNSAVWTVYWVGAVANVIFYALTMVGSTSNDAIFPGGEIGISNLVQYFKSGLMVAAIAGLVDRVFWIGGLIFWCIMIRRAHLVYLYEAGPVHQKLGTNAHKSKEAESLRTYRPSKAPAPHPSANVNVGGVDAKVSIDPRAAASVAQKAYSSGAASQLAAGSKTRVDKDGNVVIDVDPAAAKKAAWSLHQSGATKELVGATTVTSGGITVGGGGLQPSAEQRRQPSNRPNLPDRFGLVTVIHEFIGQETGDLTIRVGDQVTVIRKINDDWTEGTLNGQTGIFPSKFVH